VAIEKKNVRENRRGNQEWTIQRGGGRSHVLLTLSTLSMLPVSLDCPFWIAPLVFSNVYLIQLKSLLFVEVVKVSVNWKVSAI